MRRAAMILVVGGALLAIGLYLFPMYYGQQLFVEWTTDLAGGDELRGVMWAAVFAGVIILLGVLAVKPGLISLFSNPYYFAGAVVVVLLMVAIVSSVLGG